MTIGIYCIQIETEDWWKTYIGRSINIKERWRIHIHHLNKDSLSNKANRHLYNSWQKYGRDKFEFHILEIFEEENLEQLIAAEQSWIDEFKDNNGKIYKDLCFNINPNADKVKDLHRKNNNYYGEVTFDAKMTNNQVIEIKNLLNNTNISYQELCTKFNISMSCVRNIVMERSWAKVGPKIKRQTNSKRIFNDKDIIKIREMYFNNNFSQQDIANEYKVSQKTISRIVRNEIYKNVK